MIAADLRWLSVVGLVLDIIGVVIVWRYGLPAEISRSGAIRFVAEQEDSAETALARRYDWLGRVGLVLLILGFTLQLVGSWPR